ncbi:mannonate dehydratase [Fluviibacterium sp. DFM31]|uniref:Mannonate dehydratase n=1 Tax=Meridianimarinicoccus marinus TaxID=3231483 RepID=A0ABV3LBH8_9RHOB
MRQSWRWFGPEDNVTLSEIRQAGAAGIVTALYQIPPGEVWPREEIRARREVIEAAGLTWDVVESLPVSEAIRTGAPESAKLIANWAASLENLAAEGLSVICYNFMPVLDWIRTNLAAPMPSGATALRFDLIDFAAFDMFVLDREGAVADYPNNIVAAARSRADSFTSEDRDRLTRNILSGLPGTVERWTPQTLRERLGVYAEVDAERLRANLVTFLGKVVPTAERLDMRLCCHPDDPPWPLLGLPRIMSTEADFASLVNAVPSPANGITFCTGSLGARPDNDLPGMMERLGRHVHFLHLRNVRLEDGTVPGSFHEDEHLGGSTDMIAVIKAVLEEQARRRAEGRNDWQIPMRPDHGQNILDDRHRASAPGYPAIGRLKGLAELRGAMMALDHGSAA